uniref:Uncharacterized protein n=1 Tax=Anguilla anguilla TaxID=7936 RepID=A0A0E9SHR2_ANGAN
MIQLSHTIATGLEMRKKLWPDESSTIFSTSEQVHMYCTPRQ